MSTEWCRSSCRAEGCWEEGPLPPLSPSQRPVSSPLLTPSHGQEALTTALRGPGSGVPFSSSSWTAVARMGTLWGDMEGVCVGRTGGHSRAGHSWAQASPDGELPWSFNSQLAPHMAGL